MPVTGSKSSGRLSFELLDETLDLNNTETYHLSIQVALDGFLFAILDPARSKYLGLKKYSFEKTFNPDRQYDEIKALLEMDPGQESKERSVVVLPAYGPTGFGLRVVGQSNCHELADALEPIRTYNL